MRLAKSTAGFLATGALLFGVPAVASAASAPLPPPFSPSPVCATASSFQQVTDGQTVAQVDQEMGSAGNPGEGVVTGSHGTSFDPSWQSCSAAGQLINFSVDFQAASPDQPLLVVGKAAL